MNMPKNHKGKIEARENGPYVVSDIVSLKTSRAEDAQTAKTMVLCRCGKSRAKPHCDGSHTKIGFSSEKIKGRQPDRVDDYVGQNITIHDNRGVCSHAGHCTDNLPAVFRMRTEPWIDPEAATVEEIIRVIEMCPSGALSYTIDGRAGATAAAPKFVKAATSLPTIFALHRARKYLDQHAGDVSLCITGGLRISPDFAKALALGADAIAIGTAALMATACQQYRICHTGDCPVGVTTHKEELRQRLHVDHSANKLSNFLRVSTDELRTFARLTGCDDVHKLTISDLVTYNSEISNHTDIEHA